MAGNGHGSDEPIIRLQDLVKTYETAVGDFVALRGVTLDLHAGEFVSVVGRSGSGKSTLLNMLTGVDRPTSGVVRIAGVDIHHLREGEMARWRGRNLGIVFQFYQLLPTLSLLENTMLPMDLCDVYPRGEREERALALLDLVGLAHLAHKMPGAVSGGQQQSAAVARALATDPPIIVADEPTGNLDSHAADAVVRLMEELAARGKTVVMVTHDPHLARRASRTVILADGEVVDPVVAHAFPFLSHQQMLLLGRALEPAIMWRDGDVVTRGDADTAGALYLVVEGHVQLHRENGRAPGDGVILGAGTVIAAADLASADGVRTVARASGSAVVRRVPPDAVERMRVATPELERALTQASIGRRYVERGAHAD